MMSKKLITIVLMVLCGMVGRAQYQLPNPGFEQWDNNSATAEPVHWNSFATSDGTYASLASTPHHYHRNGGRPGTSGSSYLTIYSKSIIGVVANGNMTTGRVHAGGMSASSSDNYNYTQRSNSSHCQPFTGTPDSMYVWVSYYAASSSSQAQIGAIVHGNVDFQSPNHENNPALYCGIAQARFARTTTSATTMQWQQMKVPFNYSGLSTANYMLINITTNYLAGNGSANDSLSIDDIEFIYSAWLTDIAINGTTIDGFVMGVFDYSVALADTAALTAAEVTVQTQVSDATPAIVKERLTDSTAMVTVTVTAEDGTTVKVYHVSLSAPMPVNDDPEPSADTVRYTVTVLCDSTMGTVSPAGVSIVDSASSFTVTATAAEGFHFVGWGIDPGYANIVTDNPYTFTVVADVTLTAHFEADSTTSGIQNAAIGTIAVYPNPTMGIVTVEADGEAELYDVNGRVLMQWQGSRMLDLGAMPAGIYLLRCNGAVLRVVKQ